MFTPCRRFGRYRSIRACPRLEFGPWHLALRADYALPAIECEVWYIVGILTYDHWRPPDSLVSLFMPTQGVVKSQRDRATGFGGTSSQ